MIFPSDKTSLISKLNITIAAIHHSLSSRTDIMVTTSFGFQSALLFFLLREAGVNANFLFISSPLSYGGVAKQRQVICDLFEPDVYEVKRDQWLTEKLAGRDFLDIPVETRSVICTELKREPLLQFAKQHDSKVWVTGIRRDQTNARTATHFINGTDLGMVKMAPIYCWDRNDVTALLRYCRLPVNHDYVDMCKFNSSQECGLHV